MLNTEMEEYTTTIATMAPKQAIYYFPSRFTLTTPRNSALTGKIVCR